MIRGLQHVLLGQGRAGEPEPIGWDLSTVMQEAGDWTLTNGDMTATWNEIRSVIRALPGRSSGKRYYEMTVANGAAQTAVAIAQSDFAAISSGLPTGGYVFFRQNSQIFTTGGTYHGTTAAWGAGDVVGVAADFDAGSVSFYLNGVAIGGNYSIAPGVWFPGADAYSQNGSSFTLFLDETALQHLPAGYIAWAEAEA